MTSPPWAPAPVDAGQREPAGKYRTIFDHAPEGILILGDDLSIEECNRRAAEILGGTPDELLGLNPYLLASALQPDGRSSATVGQCARQRALAGERLRFEFLHRRRDGADCWVEISLSRMSLDQRVSLVQVFRDVSKRKATQESLRRYESIVSTSEELMSFVDRDYVYRAVNSAYLKTFSLDRDQIVGHGVAELLGRERFDATVKPQLDRCLAGNVVKYQAWIDVGRGQPRYMDMSYVPYRDAGGQVTGVVVNGRDTTEAKRAEDSLRESEQRLSLVLESTLDGVWDWDIRKGTLFLSPRWKEQLGYSDAELPNCFETWSERLHPEDRPRILGRVQEFRENPWGMWSEEFRLRHRDGSYRWVLARGTPVLDSEDRLIRLVGVHVDLTDKRHREEHLRRTRFAVERLGDQVYWFRSDGRLIDANRAACEALGYSLEELLEKNFSDIDLLQAQRRFSERPDGRAKPGQTVAEGLFRRKDGSFFPAEISHNYFEYQDCGYHLALVRDITERKRADEELRQAAAVFDNALEGVMITDADVRITAVNKAFTDITGYGWQEVRGKNPRILGSGRHGPDFYREMWASIRERGVWQGEIWNRRKNGKSFPEWLTIRAVQDQEGNLKNYVAVFADISAVKRSQAQLERLTHHDSLTGLPNRALFDARLEHALQAARRSGNKVAVVFLDLDRFKNVNDGLGHPTGDRLLQGVARRLKGCVREDDTVARLGGDEFAIAVDGVHNEAAVSSVAQKLALELSRPYQLEDTAAFVTASMGISLFPDDGEDTATLLKNADAAMYRAKEEGRNTYQFYRTEMSMKAYERFTLEAAMREGLDKGEFTLFYQPQVHLQTGQVVGLEALVRWLHPEKGLVEPREFIPLAEETGLIRELGDVVLEAACKQVSAWIGMGLIPPKVAVNVSGQQLLRGGFVSRLGELLDRSGVAGHCLELELTESSIMKDPEAAIGILLDIQALGVTFAIDDFGTGYSSLSYLKRFALHGLKIDRSFVSDIPRDSNDMAICEAIIAMGHSMAMEVTAEGIETACQQEFLIRNGCKVGQGFLFSKPLSTRETTSYLSAKPLPPDV